MTPSRQVRPRGHGTAEQMPNESGGAFLKAALTPARADDKNEKDVLFKLRSL